MKNFIIILLTTAGLTLSSCNEYLDVIPDNVMTLDYAFRMKTMAERYLFTCYSYMPIHGEYHYDVAQHAGDENWITYSTSPLQVHRISMGVQGVVNPMMNFWEGKENGKDLYEGIRCCNILLENIDIVPDMQPFEKRRYAAEAKFLKAYYHYYLLRMYGPIVLVRENLPVSASPDEVRIPRSPVDECFDYVVQLLDEATEDLPERIELEAEEMGRPTQTIAKALKAQVLTTAASPFFNGNNDYTGFNNRDGTPLFNLAYDASKWERAATACKEAIDFAHNQGYELYYFDPRNSRFDLTDTIITQLSIRCAITDKWNSEIIWASVIYWADGAQTQGMNTPRGLEQAWASNGVTRANAGPPLKIAEMFYSENGVPITEDKTWDYGSRFNLRVGEAPEKLYIKEGYTTAQLNFNREPRYYADLGFDGGIWYGNGREDDHATDLLYVQAKVGQPAAAYTKSPTGYYAKKLVNYLNTITASAYTCINYPWPMIRLADLYLLKAEALNEYNGPSQEVYDALNIIRDRAGIPHVETVWSDAALARTVDKHKTQSGLRDIIKQDRSIELAFEGARFWDVVRWNDAIGALSQPVRGWAATKSGYEGFFVQEIKQTRKFSFRDCLWPITTDELNTNANLKQNPGW